MISHLTVKYKNITYPVYIVIEQKRGGLQFHYPVKEELTELKDSSHYKNSWYVLVALDQYISYNPSTEVVVYEGRVPTNSTLKKEIEKYIKRHPD